MERATFEEGVLFTEGVVSPQLTCIKLNHEPGWYMGQNHWDSQ
jgi:hypothetical protein